MDKQYLVSKINNSEFTFVNRDGEKIENKDKKKPKDGELAVTEMNIFRTGAYKHPFYGLIDFNRKDLEEMIRNFNKGVVTEDIVLNENHMKRKPAAGWLMNMEDALRMRPVEVSKPDGGTNEEMGLFGKVGLNKKGYDFIINHEYKYLSAEIDQDYTLRDINASPKEEDEDGEERTVELQSFGMALTGIALTNNPFIPNLDKVDFAKGETVEDYKDNFVECSDDYGSDVKFVVPKSSVSDVLDSSGDQYNFSNADIENSSVNEDQEVNEEGEQEVEQENTNNNSNETNLTSQGDTMNFAQLLSDLREFDDEDYESQVEFLEDKKAESDDKEFTDAVDTLIDEKQEAKRQKEKAEKAIQRQQRFKRQKEDLEEKAQELELKNEELKHKKDEHRLQSFCSKLENKGHHQSVVNKIEQRFSELSQKQRDQKLEFVKEEGEDEELDILELMEEVLEQLPEKARLDESEKLEANQEIEVDPDANAEEPEQTKEDDSEEDEQEFDNDLAEVEGMEQFMTEDGGIDWEALEDAK